MHGGGSECSPHRECFDSIAEAKGGESQGVPECSTQGCLGGVAGGKADAVGDLEQLEPR